MYHVFYPLFTALSLALTLLLHPELFLLLFNPPHISTLNSPLISPPNPFHYPPFSSLYSYLGVDPYSVYQFYAYRVDGAYVRCSQSLYNIYERLDLQRKKFNIRYYKIHDICIEEVNVANHFSKETII